MRILLLGATGRTGVQVRKIALARGHTLRAVVRKKPSGETGAGVEWIVGSVNSPADVARAMVDQDALVSCLGQRTAKDAGILTSSAQAAIFALGSPGTRQMVVISQGLLSPSRNPLIAILKWFLARHVRDSRKMEEAVSRWSGDWTIVRPPRLTNVPAGSYRIAIGRQPGSNAISRATLATFLMDALETQGYVKKVVGIGAA